MVTCDVVLSNPNTIITSAAPVITAADASLNNNLVDGVVSNLVFYDEYEGSAANSTHGNITSRKLKKTVTLEQRMIFDKNGKPKKIVDGEIVDYGKE